MLSNRLTTTGLREGQGFNSAVSDSKVCVYPTALCWLLNHASQSKALSWTETESGCPHVTSTITETEDRREGQITGIPFLLEVGPP